MWDEGTKGEVLPGRHTAGAPSMKYLLLSLLCNDV